MTMCDGIKLVKPVRMHSVSICVDMPAEKRDISHCAAEFVHHNWDQCKNLEGEKKRTVRRGLIKLSPWKL